MIKIFEEFNLKNYLPKISIMASDMKKFNEWMEYEDEIDDNIDLIELKKRIDEFFEEDQWYTNITKFFLEIEKISRKFTKEERKELKEYLMERRPKLKKIPRDPNASSNHWQVAN